MARHVTLALATLSITAGLAHAEAPASDQPPDAPAAAPAGPEAPGRGDFDAGGVVRLPSGPDEQDRFATFNWIAVDLRGRYYLLDWLTATGQAPLAVKTPDQLMSGVEPSWIGGATVTLAATLPPMPALPMMPAYQTEVALELTAGYLREGAMLLSDKDYPLYAGDFQPGLAGGLITRVKLSSLVDLSLTPRFVYQAGAVETLTAIQVPVSAIVALGDVVKVHADLGVFTGDDLTLDGDEGGRLAAGGALTVKLGPIVAHGGAGVASLLTGGLYPSIGDSFYVDLNVRYAR